MAENEILQSTAVDAANDYDASEIQVLEGLEAVRKRPGMYIGSTSSSGLHHLVYEIVDNAIDEALAGYCSEISVTINEGNTITVVDNGRGIPVDIQAQTGKPALEVVYTVLHAGGKFGGGGYKVSGGLHGVGASVVNALSEWLVVQVHRDGKIHEMKFARGHVTEPMTIVGTTDHTGTTVTFKPDPEMFEETVYSYDILHTHTVKNHTCIEINISSNQPFFHLTPEFITTHVRKHQFLWFHFIQYFFCHGRRAVYIIRTLRILTCMHADYQSKLSSIGNNSLITDIVKISILIIRMKFDSFHAHILDLSQFFFIILTFRMQTSKRNECPFLKMCCKFIDRMKLTWSGCNRKHNRMINTCLFCRFF